MTDRQTHTERHTHTHTHRHTHTHTERQTHTQTHMAHSHASVAETEGNAFNWKQISKQRTNEAYFTGDNSKYKLQTTNNNAQPTNTPT